jgi:hypothetical protein
MEINNHKIVDYDAILDAKFGKEGTSERVEAENKAYTFYTSQILVDARKEAKVTQSELANEGEYDRFRETTLPYKTEEKNRSIRTFCVKQRCQLHHILVSRPRMKFFLIDCC